MNSKNLFDYFTSLGQQLKHKTKLTVIGSCVELLKNQPDRITENINVWLPNSQVDIQELEQINKKLGIQLDLPGSQIDTDKPYMQLVSPGIAKMGVFEPVHFMTFGNLDILIPPSEFIIASKLRLVLDDEKHQEDISFLINIDCVAQ